MLPGDLYWLKAGGGAVHNEEPRPGSKTHGLQIFVNLPAKLKHDAPASLHIKSADVPALEGDGYRVRVVLGTSNSIEGAQSPVLPLTILDGKLTAEHLFKHEAQPNNAVWLYTVQGEFDVQLSGQTIRLAGGSSIALHGGDDDIQIKLLAAKDSHFVLIEGARCAKTSYRRDLS